MHDRSDTIPLPASESRCSSGNAAAAHRCARHRASVPPMSAMKDWRDGGACTVQCAGFVDVASLRASAAAPRPARVFPPLGER